MTAPLPTPSAHRLIPGRDTPDPASFPLARLLAAAARIRAEAAPATSFDAAAHAVVDAIWTSLREEALAPVPLAVSLATTRIAPSTERPDAATRQLTLAASRRDGDGTAHPGDALAAAPGLASLVEALGLDESAVTAGHPLEPAGSRIAAFPVLAPAPESGPVHGDTVGIGGMLADGELFLIVLAVDGTIASGAIARLKVVAASAHSALLRHDHSGAGRPVPGRFSDAHDEHLTVMESMLDEQATGFRRAIADLRAEADVVDTLQSVGTRLTAQLDLDMLVQDATDAATRATGAQFGAFFYNLIDAYGESYTLYTLSGAPREAFERFPMPRNTEVFAPTFNGEDIVRCGDITADPRYGRNAPYYGMPAGHLPVRSYLAVPVVSPTSGEVLGGFFFGHPTPDRFTARHEDLAAGIAGYTAISLDNARLYQRQRMLATELQRSMLPDIREVHGFEVATRYLPAPTGADVGGDWLDVIDLPGDRTAFVIGDVMGRGVGAAAVMGQVRTAIRAYAVMDLPPAQLMRQVDDLLRSMPGSEFVTCVYAVHHPVRGTITYANAGHLPPIVVTPDGRVETRPERLGMPLRIGDSFDDCEFPFPAGSTLVLYTDGLVERRDRSARDGIGHLAGAIGVAARAERGHVAEACDAVIETVTGGRFDDDIAFLFARDLGDVRRSEEIALGTESTTAALARRFVTTILTTWGAADLIDRAILIATELVTNAVRHTGAPSRLTLQQSGARVTIAVADQDHRTPHRMDPALDDERHRGMFLVDTYAQRWGTRPTPTGKIVWAELTTAGAPVKDTA